MKPLLLLAQSATGNTEDDGTILGSPLGLWSRLDGIAAGIDDDVVRFQMPAEQIECLHVKVEKVARAPEEGCPRIFESSPETSCQSSRNGTVFEPKQIQT